MSVPRSVNRVLAPLLAGSLLLAGCGGAPTPDGADQGRPGPRDQDGPDLALVAELAPGDAPAVAAAVNGFGFDLLGEVTDGSENAITSPLSTAVLLAMVLAGAGGDTAEAMAEVLHLEDSRDVRVGALLDSLAGTEDVTLSVANALWADEEIPFHQDYLSFVRETFGATLDNADLGAASTAETIDAWVDEHTEGRIPQIAEDLGLPNADAALVLLNAVYFLGEWTTQFDPTDTRELPFTLPDGSQAQVPLMHLWELDLGYAQRDGYQLLQLPYGEDGRYGMEVLLPDRATGLDSLLGSLDAAEWREAVDSLQVQAIDEVALPRFTLEWGAELNAPLARLGMGPALTPGVADFSPMSPTELFLEVVVHKTYLRVDEEGTEAAAVTGGSMDVTSAGPELRFRVDRPFAFTISDRETGTILFLGAVADPRG